MSDIEPGAGRPSTQAGPPPLPPTPVGTPVPQLPTATNGFAVASLVLGIVGVVLTITIWMGPICDILAIVFGVIGRGKAREGAPNGSLATAGLVLGIVGLLLTVLFVLLFVVLFASNSGSIHVTHGSMGPALG